MENFFKFFEVNFVGLLIFLAFIFCVILFLDWVAKIFAWGKYKNPPNDRTSGSIVFVFSQLIVKIITDFRHFLALILVLIFAGSLAYAFNIANKSDDVNKIENLIKVLQAVVATLGGLVGSIVGYYFGESAAKGARMQDQNPNIVQNANPPIQDEGAIDEIRPINTN